MRFWQQAEKLYYTELTDLTDEHEQLIALVEPYASKIDARL